MRFRWRCFGVLLAGLLGACGVDRRLGGELNRAQGGVAADSAAAGRVATESFGGITAISRDRTQSGGAGGAHSSVNRSMLEAGGASTATGSVHSGGTANLAGAQALGGAMPRGGTASAGGVFVSMGGVPIGGTTAASSRVITFGGQAGSVACGSGLVLCNSVAQPHCANLDNDPQNCGACGHSCAKDGLCSNGLCRSMACSGTLSLGGPPALLSGENVTAVALEDLNGDKHADLVAVSSGTDSISVSLGLGDGEFATKVEYPTADSPSAVSISDLNADRVADLVVASPSAKALSVLLGQGDGSFGSRVDYPCGKEANAVSVGELNGDGRPDLAITYSTADAPSNSVRVMLGQLGGGWASPVEYTTGDNPRAIAFADLNGDGRSDLVVANQWS
ncbi:MAG TPA: FG-GAP-like repeat-containing protein, partial [Polyangiaceae bacterium]|nr:FG-GAP-like repeat-containing protein [Polyangiaceae bacterium]